MKKTDSDNKEPTTQKDKHYSAEKITIALLCVIIVLMLAFFLGLRYVERAAYTKTAAIENALETTYLSEEDSSVSSNTSSVKININTATEEELTALEGIGEARARAITAYRTEYGNFVEIEDICKVEGIGEGIFNSIKDYITVEN